MSPLQPNHSIVCSICDDPQGGPLFPVVHANVEKAVSHFFHVHCLLAWGERSNVCPLCNSKITHINGQEVNQNRRIDGEQHEAVPEMPNNEVGEVSSYYPSATERGLALVEAAKAGQQIVVQRALADGEIDSFDTCEAMTAALYNDHEEIALVILANQGVFPDLIRNRLLGVLGPLSMAASKNFIKFTRALLLKIEPNDIQLNIAYGFAKKAKHEEMAHLLQSRMTRAEKVASCLGCVVQ